MFNTEHMDIETLRSGMRLWLKHTAKAMGESEEIKTENNEPSKDPLGAVITAFLFSVGGGPISVYALSKANKMGSYKTLLRRINDLQDRGFVTKSQTGVSITEAGTKVAVDYMIKMLNLHQETIEERKREPAE